MTQNAEFTYRQDAELPALTLPWQEQTGSSTWEDVDFTSGWTFTATLTDSLGVTTVLTKTTGIVGLADGVRIDWAAGDLNVTPGNYVLRLRARRTADSFDRDYREKNPVTIEIRAAPPA